MTREILIALILKDIKELDLLTSGFLAMEEYPEPYMQLAINKANDLVANITKLSDVKVERKKEEVVEKRPEVEVEVIVTEEIVEEEEVVEVVEDTVVEEREEEIVEEDELDVEDIEEEVIEDIEEAEDDVEESVIEEKEVEEDAVVEESVIEEEEVAEEEEIPVIEEKEEDVEIKEEEQEVAVSVADSIKTAKTLLESLHDNGAGTCATFASSIENKKIADLKTALTIADRFRFQRELFAGNGGKMMQTLDDLNKMDSFDAADKYLMKNFSWNMKDMNVKDFMDLVARRFL